MKYEIYICKCARRSQIMGECPDFPIDDESLIDGLHNKGMDGLRIELFDGPTHDIFAEDLNFLCKQTDRLVKLCKRNPLDGLLNGFIFDPNQIKRITTCSYDSNPRF